MLKPHVFTYAHTLPASFSNLLIIPFILQSHIHGEGGPLFFRPEIKFCLAGEGKVYVFFLYRFIVFLSLGNGGTGQRLLLVTEFF